MTLANLLEAKGVGVKGDSIFIDMMPAETTQAVLLRNKITGTPIDHELPGYFKTDFQVIVRSASHDGGEALMKAVTDVLWMSEAALPGIVVQFIRPRTEPAVFPLSRGNLLEFNVMFEACFVKVA